MINERLFKHYRIDTTKHLGIGKLCPRPFDTVLVDKRGSCFACECQAWLPQSIGNLQIKPLEDIIGGAMHQHLQSSIQDGSYRYCNQQQCTYLQTMDLPDTITRGIKHLRLAIDDSCNLRCPSCRTGMVFHKEGSAYDLGILLADRINDWLRGHTNPVQVHMGSDGDPFASHVYRHFMEHTPRRDNITYSILTNGLMFPEFHSRIPYVISNMAELGVSIDGATRETYERLRLGGRWDKVQEALECMAEQKQRHGYRFNLHFVVQEQNWWEMETMMSLARQHDVDRVYFNRIQDWNTDLDHSQQTFAALDEFQQMLARVRGNTEQFQGEPRHVVKGF